MRAQYAFDYLMAIGIGLAVLTGAYAIVYYQLYNAQEGITTLTSVSPQSLTLPSLYLPQSYLCNGLLIEKGPTGFTTTKVGNFSFLLPQNGGTFNVNVYYFGSKKLLLYQNEPVAGIISNYIFNPINDTLVLFLDAINSTGKTVTQNVTGTLEIYNVSSNSIVIAQNITLIKGYTSLRFSINSINYLVLYYLIENEPLAYSECINPKIGLAINITSAYNISNFQIPILLSKTYFSLINLSPSGAGENVKFEYENGTPIFSWYEGNNSQYAVWWIKLNLQKGNNIIFAVTGPLQSNYLNGITTGRAYYLGGNYDNGEYVFVFYNPTNYQLSWRTFGVSGITSSIPAGALGGNYAAYANETQGDYMYTYVPNLPASNFYIDYYGYTPRLEDIYYDVNATGYGQMLRVGNESGWFGDTDTINWTVWNCPTGDTDFYNTWGLVQLYVNGTGYPTLSIWWNPAPLLGTQGSPTATNAGFTGGCNVGTVPSKVVQYGKYIGLVGDAGAAGDRNYYQLLIVRSAPPNGQMPTETVIG